MSETTHSVGSPPLQPVLAAHVRRLQTALRAAGPPLVFGLRLWASVSLALYAAFWLQLDNPYWAGASAAIVCQPQVGASLRKGWFRMIGTLVGAVMCVVLVACFPQDRVLFLGFLALWAAACAVVATLLRNLASYAAALSGYTVAIVGGGLLGATGGVDANAAFLLAVSRATDICLGIACAGVVLAGSDLGGARRRLAAQFADLSARITTGITSALMMTGAELAGAQPARRELLRQVIGLDPIIDQTIGESPQIRYRSPVLQSAVDGLFIALAAWRAVADHRVRAASGERQPAMEAIVDNIPPELRSAGLPSAPSRLIDDPTALRWLCEAGARRLIALPAGTPSQRLVADKTAEALAGIAQALGGLALLVAVTAPPVARREGWKPAAVADWLPTLVNGARAFVAIAAVAVLWVVTGWPGGSGAITFTTISILLLGPLGDQPHAAAMLFTAGAILDLAIAAIVKFAVLPGLGTETFVSFSLVIGICLVPIGALLAQARQPSQVILFTGMTIVFIPVLAPTNPISYDPAAFYNNALTIITGAAVAALSFRVVPPLTPTFRARHLLALILRDLHRLAAGHLYRGWVSHIQARLVAMPEAATPLQRAQLLAALWVGSELIRLRASALHCNASLGRNSGFGAEIDAALAQGDISTTNTHLARLDAMLAARPDCADDPETILRMRAGILALTEALAEHAAFFGAGGSDEVH